MSVLNLGDKGAEVKTLQDKLIKYGYLKATISGKKQNDGVFGKNTEAGVKLCQKHIKENYWSAIDIDGIAGEQVRKAFIISENVGLAIRYNVDINRIKCQCGGKYCNGHPAVISEKALQEKIRLEQHSGIKANITSALRCEKRNAAVGGVKGSQHVTGLALDLDPQGNTQLFFNRANVLFAGRYGLGIYDWGIHLDVRDVKARFDYSTLYHL